MDFSHFEAAEVVCIHEKQSTHYFDTQSYLENIKPSFASNVQKGISNIQNLKNFFKEFHWRRKKLVKFVEKQQIFMIFKTEMCLKC